MEVFVDELVLWLRTSGVRVLFILIGAFIVIRIFKVLIRKSKDRIGVPEKVGIERAKRTDTLASIMENTVRVVVLITGFGTIGGAVEAARVVACEDILVGEGRGDEVFVAAGEWMLR